MSEPSVNSSLPQQTHIQEWIATRQFGRLKEALTGMEVHDLAEMLIDLPSEEELAVAFRLLPHHVADEVFAYLGSEQQHHLLDTLSNQRVAEIVNEMPPDDRTELLEELPGEVAQQLVNELRGEERKIATALLDYPEDSIGRLMTPEYVAVRAGWTVQKVLEHIRKVAATRETVDVLYVVDERWRLVDTVRLCDLVLAGPEQTIETLMDNQVAYLEVTDDQETAIEMLRKYDEIALPVVDGHGVLVGIVTFDDVMDVQTEETTEDMQMMAGMAALEESYFSAGFGRMLKKRLPWLMLLLLAETGAVMVLAGFEKVLTLLAMFMPLINATAGNTGSQVAGLMIRGFAVEEIAPADWLRVLARELSRGLLMGVLLAGLGFVVVLAFGRGPAVGLAVAIAMVAAVTLANFIGSMLPFFFRKLGVDPAVTSGPFIACLMDISSILIFFTIATSILGVVA